MTAQYRLGIFGWLGSRELQQHTTDGSAGNFGLQDQRLGLQWVQEHIGAFVRMFNAIEQCPAAGLLHAADRDGLTAWTTFQSLCFAGRKSKSSTLVWRVERRDRHCNAAVGHQKLGLLSAGGPREWRVFQLGVPADVRGGEVRHRTRTLPNAQ